MKRTIVFLIAIAVFVANLPAKASGKITIEKGGIVFSDNCGLSAK